MKLTVSGNHHYYACWMIFHTSDRRYTEINTLGRITIWGFLPVGTTI